MTRKLCAIGLLVLTTGPVRAQAPTALDPVGKWNIATVSDDGQAMTVAVDITGKPGAYTGTAVTSLNRSLPLRELATTPNGFVALFDLPQGAIVVRIVREGGKYVGAWGAVEQTFGLTAERAK
jgi:hypothetical protein